jgi:hypothetical protein
MNRLAAGERVTAIGAIVVVISGLLAMVSGFGMAIIPVLGAIAALVVLYLNRSSTQAVSWPAPVPLVLLGISAVTAVLAVVLVMPFLSVLAFFGIGMLALIALVIGSLVMIAGSWQEYQSMPRTATATSASGGTTARSSATGPMTGTGATTTGGTTGTSATGSGTTASSDYTDPTR